MDDELSVELELCAGISCKDDIAQFSEDIAPPTVGVSCAPIGVMGGGKGKRVATKGKIWVCGPNDSFANLIFILRK